MNYNCKLKIPGFLIKESGYFYIFGCFDKEHFCDSMIAAS